MQILLLLIQLGSCTDTRKIDEESAMAFFDFVMVEMNRLNQNKIDEYFRKRQEYKLTLADHYDLVFNSDFWRQPADLEIHFLPDMKTKYQKHVSEKFKEKFTKQFGTLFLGETPESPIRDLIEQFLDGTSILEKAEEIKGADKFTFQPTLDISNRYERILEAFRHKMEKVAARSLRDELIKEHESHYKGGPNKVYHEAKLHFPPNKYSNEVAKLAKPLLESYFKGYIIGLKCVDLKHSTDPEKRIEMKISRKRKWWYFLKYLKNLDPEIKKICIFAAILFTGIEVGMVKAMRFTKRQYFIYGIWLTLPALMKFALPRIIQYSQTEDGVVFEA